MESVVMSMKRNDEPTVYTVEEAGKLLRLGRASAFKAANAGQIPTIRIGRRLLVPRAALDRLLSGGAP
jgi:excisionase family DNA binding protein